MEWVIFNGETTATGEAQLPADSRPVAYGDGCFDTMRYYEGYFLEFDKHLERLHKGMEYLGLDIPDQLGNQPFNKHIKRLLEENDLTGKPAVIRTQVWRKGSLGYAPDRDAGTGWMISASELPGISGSIELSQVPTRRIPSASLNSSYKLSNGINYIRAAREAREQGADDALMVTLEDYVSETTIANIFWNQGDSIFTPNLECDILPGITRAILSHIIRNQTDYKLVKGRFTISDLARADAVWVCNSLREILPVRSVDDHSFDINDPVLSRLQELFESYKDQHLQPLEI